VAAAKGLVVGSFIIRMKDGATVDYAAESDVCVSTKMISCPNSSRGGQFQIQEKFRQLTLWMFGGSP
jgi:hypothetical protein